MKIFLDTIGCRLNQAEIESLARQFRAGGNEIVATASEADLAVVNTCAVTSEAASDSRAAIRRAKRLGAGEILVTGCWATLEPEKAESLPGVTRIVPNEQKERLAAEFLSLPQEFFDLEPIARKPLPGLHLRTRAFVKVQDGCDNVCTFCITRVARGSSRSRSLDVIIRDVESALNGGAKEIVLTGVSLGSWGLDFLPAQRLTDLVSDLLSRTSAPRLRLSSLEPWDLETDFFSLWRNPSHSTSKMIPLETFPHLCRHLHLPLQSGSEGVLKRMSRKSSPDSFAKLVKSAREAIPELAITTDVIVGFPGETDREFKETEEFVRSMQFSGGHVFPYSARPGTPATRMKGQVLSEVIKARSTILRRAIAESAEAYQRHYIGKTMSVLWESLSILTDEGWQIEGLTDNYLRVTAISREPRWNQIDQVRLRSWRAEGLWGEIQE